MTCGLSGWTYSLKSGHNYLTHLAGLWCGQSKRDTFCSDLCRSSLYITCKTLNKANLQTGKNIFLWEMLLVSEFPKCLKVLCF